MAAIQRSVPDRAGITLDYFRVGVLSVGHLANDMYGNALTALMPYLVLQGRITATFAGLVLLLYLIGSSIPQPFLGLMSDQSGRRFLVVLGPLWIGAAASLVGWASNGGAVLALALVGGLGTAAFHPQAASMVDRLSAGYKGRAMAIFSMGGNLGFALGPLAAALIALAGLHWSLILILPGIPVALLVARYAPRTRRSAVSTTRPSIRAAARGSWGALSLIVAVIAIRSAVQYALIIFLPLYYHARGLPPQLGSYIAFVLSVAGAFGGLAGGNLSDRHGRKIVVVSSLLASVPLLYLALLANGWWVWPLVAVGGAALLASNSVTVVQGQELLPGNTGVASGLTLGFAFGLSGIFTATLTAVSDHIGVQTTIFMVPAMALVGACIALFVRQAPGSRPAPADHADPMPA